MIPKLMRGPGIMDDREKEIVMLLMLDSLDKIRKGIEILVNHSQGKSTMAPKRDMRIDIALGKIKAPGAPFQGGGNENP